MRTVDALRVILLCSNTAETRTMQAILGDDAVVTRVKDCYQLQDCLETGDYDAVLCEWSFGTGSWRAVLKVVQWRRPNLPVIVFTQLGGKGDWTQVLQEGAFDLLVGPYSKQSVFAALEQAVASCEPRMNYSKALQEQNC